VVIRRPFVADGLVLVVVIAVRCVAMPVVDVVHVIVVGNCLVTAIRAVNMIRMRVGLVLGARHVDETIAYMRM
jgi:hypothetical protein